MADQVAVMTAGCIEQVGHPEDLYRRPVSPAVAAFVGDAVLLGGRRVGGRVRCALGEVEAIDGAAGADGDWVRVLLRPEQVLMRPVSAGEAAGSLEGRPAPVAVVRAIDFYGHDAEVELDLAGGLARLAGAVGLPGGTGPHQMPADDGDRVRVRARTAARDLPERGALVRLEVSGPAVVYPADPAEERPGDRATRATG